MTTTFDRWAVVLIFIVPSCLKIPHLHSSALPGAGATRTIRPLPNRAIIAPIPALPRTHTFHSKGIPYVRANHRTPAHDAARRSTRAGGANSHYRFAG